MSMTYMKPADMQFVIEVLDAPNGLSLADKARASLLAVDFREQLVISRSHPRKPQRVPEPTSKIDKWINIEPDWSQLWTAPESEHQLADFTFLGPGWYLTKTDTMLVVPDSNRPIFENWNSKRLPGEYFRFMIWNASNPVQAFNNIANAPVKVDTRA